MREPQDPVVMIDRESKYILEGISQAEGTTNKAICKKMILAYAETHEDKDIIAEYVDNIRKADAAISNLKRSRTAKG